MTLHVIVMLPKDITMKRQGTALNEHKFDWIRMKHEPVDTSTKPGTLTIFSSL